MPLPTPKLDDRRFQDIVDEAKRLIPQYCPEWTDHNVSDPGVTLIELFAWMTDLLLYRVNQVPDKMYVHFLELIGVRLAPPRPAQVAVTFYLSKTQDADLTIPSGAEVSTLRAEGVPAVVFTTETALVIRPPRRLGAFTGSVRQQPSAWTEHDLGRLGHPAERIALFPPGLEPGDAFYLAFAEDLSHHVLALVTECEVAGWEGINPDQPPLIWEVAQDGGEAWLPCEVEHDGTRGFNVADGTVVLHLPTMGKATLRGLTGRWLRCRLTDAMGAGRHGLISPNLLQLREESRGGTVRARHAVSIQGEVLGVSDGDAGQRFRLQHAPVLARDPEQEHVLVGPPEAPVVWREVRDFAGCRPEDPVYVLDDLSGQIELGPALPQPDGTVHRFGAVPPRGARLTMSRYQVGGGTAGNVAAGAIQILRQSIPYVARVTNRRAAEGGRDAQTLDDAKLRAPQHLRTQQRAVTAEDFEHLAGAVPGVARACCLAPRAVGEVTGARPGEVIVLILANPAEPARVRAEDLTPSPVLLEKVQQELDQRRPLGIQLRVRGPAVQGVSIEARLHPLPGRNPADLRARALAALTRQLSPWPDEQGRPGRGFGEALHLAEIHACLQSVAGLAYVSELKVSAFEPGGQARPVTGRLEIGPVGLIWLRDAQLGMSGEGE